MRRTSLVVACLSLVACGDDAPGRSPVPGGAPPPPFAARTDGTALTPEELAKAMRMPKGGEAAAKELTDALKARLGPTLEEDAKKAKAFAERPLTAADVETYLAVTPEMRSAATIQGGAAALLARHGLTGMEWGVLSGRISALRMALRVPDARLDAKTAADVETLRPFAERLEAASRAR